MKKTRHSFKFLPNPGKRRLSKTNPDVLIDVELYPLIPITLYNGDIETRVIEGLIDTGADKSLIPRDIADYLMLDNLGDEMASGINGVSIHHITRVGLRIGRGGRVSDIGYIDCVYPDKSQDQPILLGRTPLLDEFQLIVEKYKGRLHLIPKEETETNQNRKSPTKQRNRSNKYQKQKRINDIKKPSKIV